MVHWLSPLHADPDTLCIGNTGPARDQLMRLVSLVFCRKLPIVPFPGVIPRDPSVGLKFSPPPLNMNVRIDGCSKMIPPPPRSMGFPVPKTSHAKPSRGEMLL